MKQYIKNNDGINEQVFVVVVMVVVAAGEVNGQDGVNGNNND